jgi:hypothetical protein
VTLGINEQSLPNWRGEFLQLVQRETGRSFSSVNEAWRVVQEDEDLKRFRPEFPRMRISYMAKIRNQLIKPLVSGEKLFIDAEEEQDQPVLVVFLNDVIFSYDQILRLIDTKISSGLEHYSNDLPFQYDAVCALDFSGMSMYDTWVARDINGKILSSEYPFFADQYSRARVRMNQAVPVFSCWNGIVIMKGEVFTSDNITFRSWTEGEPRSPSKHALRAENYSSVNPESCSASECALIFNDMWSKGKSRFFINPAVRVGYTWKDYYLIKYASFFVDLFMDFFNQLPETKYDAEISEETYSLNMMKGFPPPDHVDCGNMFPIKLNWKFYALSFSFITLLLFKVLFALRKYISDRLSKPEKKYKIQLSKLKHRNSGGEISKMA